MSSQVEGIGRFADVNFPAYQNTNKLSVLENHKDKRQSIDNYSITDENRHNIR
jgi:hypothetical protein